ncbi:MAG TPA: hypothetical protein VHB21_03615, partial [Minicystis sp.]|nr:hypothetical protein [Minicystis sp.]
LGVAADSRSGDRDTPTRAIPAPAFDDPQRRMAPQTLTLKSYAADEKTGQLPDPADPLRRAAMADVALMQTLPASALPGASQGDAAAPLASTVPLSAAAMDSPFKPGWQKTLDRWLVAMGRAVDGWLAKYRAAPKNTQILVIACGASVALLFIVLIFFVAR